MTLRDCLINYYPVTAVRYLAQTLGIANEKKAQETSKADLSFWEMKPLLTPEMMASRLSMLSEKEMELFEWACLEHVRLVLDEQEDGRKLHDCRYAFLIDPADAPFPADDSSVSALKALKWFANDRFEVPEDVVSLYKTVNSPEFRKRRRIVWMSAG